MLSPELGYVDPEHVVGIHLNAASVGFIPFGKVDEAELATFSDVETERLEPIKEFLGDGNGYIQMHATRPQTTAYPLADSPARSARPDRRRIPRLGRRAAWRGGHPRPALTNVMLYWLTGTAGSPANLYYENMHAAPSSGRPPSTTPTGVAAFATDVAIRRNGERGNTIVHWSDRGGRFAAMETPAL